MPPTPTLIRKIYALVDQLQTKHPGRHFTPDGHMVGSLGEAYAEEAYGLTLLSSSAKTHDAKKGKKMIHATSRSRRYPFP